MSDQAELSPDLPIGRVPNEEVVDGAESGRSLTAGNTSMWGKVLGYLAPPRGSRFTSLDGYRALAALGVVVYHVAGKPLTSEDSVMGRFLFNLGNFGVAIFFLLSGFLLYRPFVMNWFNDKPSPDPIIYIRHRLLRIFPAYWAALTLFLVFVFKAQAKQGADFYVTLYSLTQTYRNSYGLAGISVAWTLSIEVSFYIALPFIAALIRLIGRGARTTKMKMEAQLIGVVILFVVSVGYRVLVAAPYQLDTKPDGKLLHAGSVAHLWLFNYLDWFALGMLLAVCICWVDSGRPLPNIVQRFANTGWFCWLVAAVCYGILMAVRENSTDVVGVGAAAGTGRETVIEMLLRFLLNGLAAFFFLLPGVVGSKHRGLIVRGLSSLPMIYLGMISYGLYLWHRILLDYLVQGPFKNQKHAFWYVLAIVLGLAVFSASASYYLLEKPLLRFKNPRRLRRRVLTATPK